MFKFKLSYVAFATALTSSFVYADPTIYTHQTGTQIIDIEAPNAAGVSHNMYREFNVGSKGMILNNNGSNYTHNTLGNIAKNNNLTNGSASVILNEVISNKSSSLQGFIEVGGQKADVVIANPNGITCSGCSFINTNKAVLTTGKVNFSDTGAISSYDVTGGNITIGKDGMDAANNYAVILADAININGTITAANAIIGGGNFTFDNSTGKLTSHQKSASLKHLLMPEYSIDISMLGGVKANSITMIGNNLGFGVRNKGAIIANSTLAMSSNGSLINEGQIVGKGFVTQMVSAGELNNSGTISTKNIAMLNTLSNLVNTGEISNTGSMAVSASGNMENKGTIHAAQSLAVNTGGNLTTAYGSWLGSDNQASVNVLGNVDHGGSLRAQNTSVSFGGDTLKVTGDIYGYTTAQVQAAKNGSLTSGEITNAGIISGNDIALATNGSLITDYGSMLEVGKSLTAHSHWLSNGGSIRGNSADMNFDNYVTTNTGNIIGGTLNILTQKDLLNTGLLESKGDLTINTQNQGKITNQGTMKAAQTMTLDATQVVNGGYKCGFLNLKTCGAGSLSANKLVLNSKQKYANTMGGSQAFKATEINTK
ncbi:filamentous hemagglutinin N-terminal domain-containing protein [Leclercia adecarboxylata]|uniref:filamentous hemagglutinin N-terminal domain-containing protein n=1 Tax=Leclercia adecarboxylata TaxID=83655 RepID=UPI00254BAD57|nr:filamentous hemagglutinin N-terminal domain-containing protein [Leclercia adecarboxylata]